MKILLLGVGMQGMAALHDLANSPDVSQVIAADKDLESLQGYVTKNGWSKKVRCRHFDAADATQIASLLATKPRVVIDLLPVPFRNRVAELAVHHGCHLVTTYYTSPKLYELSEEAEKRGVAILPEFGLDPGIDLVMLGEVVRSLNTVTAVRSYGGGIPEPEAADNPLKYKVIWSLVGVLRAYRRRGVVIRDGRLEEIAPNDIFNPENIHEINIPGLGSLEAYPNGDASAYLGVLGLDPKKIDLMGRYALRWPGHCAFWKILSELHLLDEDPVEVEGTPVNRHQFLAAVLTPHIRLKDVERDMAIIRIEAEGTIRGNSARRVLQMIDTRDLDTGLTAMSRTVGYTASVGAQMIATSKITRTGLLSPVRDVPFELFVKELERRDIFITQEA